MMSLGEQCRDFGLDHLETVVNNQKRSAAKAAATRRMNTQEAQLKRNLSVSPWRGPYGKRLKKQTSEH